jgi:hypothetical protein
MNERIGKALTLERVKTLVSSEWPYEMHGMVRSVSEQDENDLMKDLIDLHIHAFPDIRPRTPRDMIEVCKDGSKVGMCAMVFKDHFTQTADRAYLTQRYIDEWAVREGVRPVQVYGGMALNYAVGGLNPEAVAKAALYPRFKVVWFPSVDSFNQRREEKREGGLYILNEDGTLRSEVEEIVATVAGAKEKIMISTCHITPEEVIALSRETKKKRVDLVVDHATQELTRLSLDQMKEVVDNGGYVGLFACSCLPNMYVPVCDPVEAIKVVSELGPEHLVVASDFGQVLGMQPVEGFRLFVRALASLGISKEDIETMGKKNPAKILGI